jgi:hypothetical protein
LTAQKVQDAAEDKFRKHDKFTKKTKGTNNTGKETLEVEDDETEAATDEDDNGSDDEGSTVSEGVGDKLTHGRDRKNRHLKSQSVASSVSVMGKTGTTVDINCAVR